MTTSLTAPATAFVSDSFHSTARPPQPQRPLHPGVIPHKTGPSLVPLGLVLLGLASLLLLPRLERGALVCRWRSGCSACCCCCRPPLLRLQFSPRCLLVLAASRPLLRRFPLRRNGGLAVLVSAATGAVFISREQRSIHCCRCCLMPRPARSSSTCTISARNDPIRPPPLIPAAEVPTKALSEAPRLNSGSPAGPGSTELSRATPGAAGGDRRALKGPPVSAGSLKDLSWALVPLEQSDAIVQAPEGLFQD